MLRLTGTALITGAAQGIGRATALAYARAGAAAIAIADIKTSQLQEVATEARKVATCKNFEAVVIQTDVTNKESVRCMVETAVRAFGRIDYASNIAGVNSYIRPERKSLPTVAADKTTEDFNFTNDVNINGVFYCQREELKAMRKQEIVGWGNRPGVRGSIVNMSSIAGVLSMPCSMAYVTGKHAVIGMTKSAATDHVRDAIRINAVCPGLVGTSFVNDFAGIHSFDQLLVERSLMKRLAHPDEIADVVLFLSSPMASFVTGAAWIVDGGMSVI